ncbi:hypothetical protein ABIB25_005912 [Nakamurella sp. UYEF19]|uniref:nSTAND1 domain-containing NTPase n=1 Tax=Nakamurella sp. UYEF19 TaxID=1756392 RepID=UPI003394266D
MNPDLACFACEIQGREEESLLTNQTSNQEFLEKKINEFRRAYPHAEALLTYLKRDELRVVRVERGKQGRWSVFCVLPETAQQIFDIDREVLFLATDYEKVEPRILNELQRLLRENASTEEQLAVLVTVDEQAERLARQRAGETSILVLDAKLLPSGLPPFRQNLASLLSTVDHFNVTTPLTAASAFFGRERDIASVLQRLDVGQHTGIFGLRKAGKSSLLNRVSGLEIDRRWAVGNLDLNEYFGTPGRFRSEVVKALADEVTRLGGNAGRLLSVSAPRGDTVREFWLRDLGAVLDNLGSLGVAGTLLVIDEVDTALPGRTLALDEDEDDLGLLRALSQLRAFVQRRQARGLLAPVMLCAGVDPSLFEKPKVRGLANPLYQFASVEFIEPLDRDELQAMVRTLGKRTGMRFRDSVLIDELLAEYGGHPLLTRQACSFIHRHRPAGEVPYQVDLQDVMNALEATGPGTPLEHALDMPSSFEEWYPDEAEALDVRIKLSREGRFVADIKGVEHAAAYGLLRTDGSVRMRALTRGIV